MIVQFLFMEFAAIYSFVYYFVYLKEQMSESEYNLWLPLFGLGPVACTAAASFLIVCLSGTQLFYLITGTLGGIFIRRLTNKEVKDQ